MLASSVKRKGRRWQSNTSGVVSQMSGSNTKGFLLLAAALTAALTLASCPPSAERQTIMLPGDVPLEMVWIAPGTFMMGRYVGEQDSFVREDPQHMVTLTQGFWLGKYEVTQRQWGALMENVPWSGHTYVSHDLDSPAVWVTWDDAYSFIAALNRHTGLVFRLPSEAEWEYACRAGTTTRFYWGDDPTYTVGNAYTWWKGNTDSGYFANPVGQKLPNGWGLHDMSGNVLEWCDDRYGGYSSESVLDPVGAESGQLRLLRGGAGNSAEYDCRSASRTFGREPNLALRNFGFRIALSP